MGREKGSNDKKRNNEIVSQLLTVKENFHEPINCRY